MRGAALLLALALAAFVFVEGLASLLVSALDLARHASRPLAERAHTEYDPELGWVNRPNVSLPDLYGPGLSFTTNARRTRDPRPVPAAAPAGTRRAICSGDSFTLGYGVADGETWCARLAALAPGLETVNMGQGGYGFDQAYLWYARDAAALSHDLHLFAVVTLDFDRMTVDAFQGYGKPVLRFAEGRLVVENVPVPRRAYYVPWLTRNAALLRRLGSVELLVRVLSRRDRAEVHRVLGSREAARVVAAVVAELARRNREKASELVLVYLPVHPAIELASGPAWRRLLRRESARRGAHFVDLSGAFDDLPPRALRRLLLQPGEVDFPGAEGHYSAEGNAYVAGRLHEALQAIPRVRTRLARGS